MRPKYTGIMILLAAITSVAQAQFDSSFEDRAMGHVRYLAALGNRVTGSKGEAKAIRYIREQFEKMGLAVSTEPFEFRSFALDKAVVSAGGQSADVVQIIFDPYAGVTRMEGEVVFISAEAVDERGTFSRLELKDKLVIAQAPANAYRINSKRPRAIVFVSAPDFGRLQKLEPATVTIQITGREVRLQSANVVASLRPKEGHKREVIVSAHLDSVRVPGADDNASGMAVLLELARYYRNLKSQPPFALRFIALGAEEVGMLGAKAYLGRHLDELKDCALVFNMDSIGGKGEMHVEMRDGVQGIAGKAVNQLPKDLMDKALFDVDSRWMYIPQGVVPASDVPEWLQSALKSTAKDLGIEFVPSRDMGSDHVVFAQAGIVATNVEISGVKIHTLEDVPEQVAPASLERAARFIAGVVTKVPASE